MLTVVQAFDRAPIADIETDDAAALERKLQAADQVFRDRDGWLKPHRRIAILRRLAALMEDKRDHLAMQIAREGGKPLPDAIVETNRAIDGVHNAADELRNFAGREIPMGLSAAAENRWAFTTREPIRRRGNLGVQSSAEPDRPSGRAGHRGRLPGHRQAGDHDATVLPRFRGAGPGGGPARAVVPDLRDGRQRTGRKARDRWPRRLPQLHRFGTGRLVAACQARPRHALGPRAWRSRTRHRRPQRRSRQGDRAYRQGRLLPCRAGLRFDAAHFVHDDIAEEFTQMLVARVEDLRTADPTLQDTEVGPLILPREADRVAQWIKEALEGGATLATGGNYRALDDAIRQANALPTAFQASIFAQDIDVAMRAANRLDASAVMINDPTAFRTDWMPFAGRRESGYGTGGIPCTMRDMTQEKMILMRRS